MKTIDIKINLWRYAELGVIAKQKAFDEHFYFLCSVNDENHTEKEIENQVEESIAINEYWFFDDGIMADCITYTGEHPKAGITELNFQGKAYVI